jgi:predicted ATP-dependent endonuclease of OLD family
MKIQHLEVQNFRKLKSCRIDISKKETILVGANNSGKTSAMDALIFFLKKKSNLKTTDFTLSNWIKLNKLGEEWLQATEDNPVDLSLDRWIDFLPSLDIWINVEDDEVHYVAHLIPTLDWTGGMIGVRLMYVPIDIGAIYKTFKETISNAKEITRKVTGHKLELWPIDLKDFFEKKLASLFTLKSFVLDPEKLQSPVRGEANPQKIENSDLDIGNDPLKGIVRVDIINAQRGFSDSNNDEDNVSGKLSSQLREYYSKHLNPEENPTEGDIEALSAISEAQESFDTRLQNSFKPSIGELENLGYPGFSDPSITLSSKVDPMDSLKHSAAVKFDILKDKSEKSLYSLPENYNGLGYQNLVSMVFRLIRFRDDWLRVGKKGVDSTEEESIEPIHLVLIEEPEAHLHVQVQQVFIRKAHSVLSNHILLKEASRFTTHLVLSTHSSHIAHEIDFTSLRYFKRKETTDIVAVPTATVENLSEVFGGEDETTKFSIRYLKTTHCDLFFADAIILVEGAAERMLLPHFITREFHALTSRYLSILEVGGSHAHRLKPIIEALDIPTLIISDLDSCDPSNRNSAAFPERKKGYVTNNDSLKVWIPDVDSLDELLDLKQKKKITADGNTCIAYQVPFQIKIGDDNVEVIPYTFEDALFFTNLDIFKGMKGSGFIKKFCSIATQQTDISTLRIKAYEEVKNKNNSKAQFALDLLFLDESDKLIPPEYISEGLDWLCTKTTRLS